ncbi:MAG: helix-turn-helix transcriptional regulator [Treponema sp.]|nr:helix-turn-helix transcriptional regulator [Treponema sp.]
MTQMELRQNLSANIKMYRKRLSLTQEKLAEKSELSSQTINDIEGCRTWVSDKSLVKISEVLYTTPSDLLLSQVDEIENSPLSDKDLLRLKSNLSMSFEAQIDLIFDELFAMRKEIGKNKLKNHT